MEIEKVSPGDPIQGADKCDLNRQVEQLGLIVAMILEILATWAEADGMSLLFSQQLNGPSSQRNENVRMLLQRIRELGETSLFKWGT